ncbi:MAG: phosphate ABC transporter, permease protein PstA [Firmicutes bacterium HGW-Firmicutes-9]|jgi:phosphate transport system permease protein|nr:MAG: phosphate ABC transporter, permease protein PstA [Firmicutes bacterium HGW-Firmicutes-9]
MKRQKISALLLRLSVYLATIITIGALLFVAGYVLVKGVPNLSWKLFEWKYTTDNLSLLPALLNTILMTALSLLIAVPLGVFAAIYLVEYAKRGSKLVRLIRMNAETLAGIPSIVYGLFGMLFFVTALKLGFSMLSGALTISIMILPVILRTSEEALMSVPDSFREGSFGLGAGRLRTVFRVVLPDAIPGILAGVILGVGRTVGETAALLYTAGTSSDTVSGIMDSARTLSVHMYALSQEGLYINQTYATAVVLLVIVVGINALSAMVAKRVTRRKI